MKVLDNGFVELVDHMGSDLTVVNAARVSFNSHSKELVEKDIKLIKYLAYHKHWTPFAHPQITLRVKAPIFIRTQLFKHKIGFVENEISRRYVSFEPEFYLPEWRSKPIDGVKQGSSNFINSLSSETNTKIFLEATNKSNQAYLKLLACNVAPEQARSVLPQSMYTEWYWTGSLFAYSRVYRQRIDPHAQWEAQQYAKAIALVIEPLYPISWKQLTNG